MADKLGKGPHGPVSEHFMRSSGMRNSDTETLTKEQVIARYGDVPLKFSSYYKYTFTYTGTADDGAIISASEGGNADDIYRHEVSRDSSMTLKDNMWYSASVYRGAEELWSEYSY